MDDFRLSSLSSPQPSSTLHPGRRNHPLVIPLSLPSSEHDVFRQAACNDARAPAAAPAGSSYSFASAAVSGTFSFFWGDGGRNGTRASLENEGTSRVDVDGLELQFADLNVGDGFGRGSCHPSRGRYGRAGAVRPPRALEGENGSHGGLSCGSLLQNYAMLPNVTSAPDGGGARNGYSYDYGQGRTSVFSHYVKQPADQEAFDGCPLNDAPGVNYLNGLNENPLNSFANSPQPRSALARNISSIQSQRAGLDANWSIQSSFGLSNSSHFSYRFPNAEVDAPPQWRREIQSLVSKRNPRSPEDFGSDNYSIIFQGRDLSFGGRNGGDERFMLQDLPDRPCYSPPRNICNRRMQNLATEQETCLSLQQMLEEGRPEEVEKVYNGIICHVAKLIKHPLGNYLIQKLLVHCNEEQKLGIIRELTGYPSQLIEISKNHHGTRAVQWLIKILHTREQISLVASALKPGVLDLVKDTHGNHVIKSCLESLRDEDKKFIFDVFAKHCIDIATNCHGCCLLQYSINNFSGEYRSRLLDQICSNGLHLSVDDYGNYVIQFILGLKNPRATSKLMRQFEGHYVELSKMKFSSHVVEKCLVHFKEEGRDIIIRELLSVSPFDQLLQDPFANYVIKKALQCTQGSQRNALVEAIRPYEAYLRSSPFCKKIFYLLKN